MSDLVAGGYDPKSARVDRIWQLKRWHSARWPNAELTGPVERRVGRSRYAEESQAAAPRFILHLHFLNREEVILQPFVRTRQHDFNIDRLL